MPLNETSLYILENSPLAGGWEPVERQLLSVAEAVNRVEQPEKKKEILDRELVSIISAYSSIARTLTRVLCLTLLVYKQEKLYKLDLDTSDFRDDTEAFLFWANEFLKMHQPQAAAFRSKVKHYLRVHNDLKAIEEFGFEKSCLLSKYETLFKDYREPLPESAKQLAERKEVGYTELNTHLKEKYWMSSKAFEFRSKNGVDPPGDVVKQWQSDYYKENRVKLPSALSPSKEMQQFQSKLRGLEKGDTQAMMTLLHSLVELLPSHLDPDQQSLYKFIHRHYPTCAVSGKRSTENDPITVHHLVTRGAVTNRVTFNLVPVLKSVHEELHSQGQDRTFEKYNATQEAVFVSSVWVLLEYLKSLESNHKRTITIQPQGEMKMDPKKLEKLRAPLEEIDYYWRVKNSGIRNDGQPWALIVCYIQAESIQDRLDDVLGPTNWQNTFIQTESGIEHTISIREEGTDDWIAKTDVADWAKERADAPDAQKFMSTVTHSFKRSAQMVGIGRELKRLPRQVWAVFEANGPYSDVIKADKNDRGTRFGWRPPATVADLIEGKEKAKQSTPKAKAESTPPPAEEKEPAKEKAKKDPPAATKTQRNLLKKMAKEEVAATIEVKLGDKATTLRDYLNELAEIEPLTKKRATDILERTKVRIKEEIDRIAAEHKAEEERLAAEEAAEDQAALSEEEPPF